MKIRIIVTVFIFIVCCATISYDIYNNFSYSVFGSKYLPSRGPFGIMGIIDASTMFNHIYTIIYIYVYLGCSVFGIVPFIIITISFFIIMGIIIGSICTLIFASTNKLLRILYFLIFLVCGLETTRFLIEDIILFAYVTNKNLSGIMLVASSTIIFITCSLFGLLGIGIIIGSICTYFVNKYYSKKLYIISAL